jgi:PAS domain-containing protein
MQPRAPRPLVDDAEPHGYKNPDAEMRPEMQIGLPADAGVAATPDFDELAADILDRIREEFYAVDRHWRLVYANHAACEMWGTDLGAEKKEVRPAIRAKVDRSGPANAATGGRV